MENSSYALKIAAGVFFALLTLSLLIFAFNKYKELPKQIAEQKQIEERLEFNKRFEVYNKPQMYGTDVISCKNLADSVNVFELGNKVDSNDLKNSDFMTSSLSADGTRNVEVVINYKGSDVPNTIYKIFFPFATVPNDGAVVKRVTSDTLESIIPRKYEQFKKYIPDSIRGRTLNNVAEENLEVTVIESDQKPSNFENSLNQTITINNKNFNLQTNNWSKVEIIPAGAEIKKRIFKCENIFYDKDHYVKKIVFKEID